MANNKIMCVNAGSSSLKFKLYEIKEALKSEWTLKEKASKLQVLTSGVVERISHDDAIFTIKLPTGEKHREVLPVKDHDEAVKLVLDGLLKFSIISTIDEISGIGHRVVQGGKYFADSALFTQDTYDKIEELIPLDPLHAPAHLTCFNAFKKALPNVGEVAVFDTSFHQTMEPKEYMYAIPYEYYEKYSCRRYGAHGTSHKYLSMIGDEEYLKDLKTKRIITLHIGSGASVAAIVNGKCIATSMGLTPLAGVMMGTRTGDIDPSCMPYLCDCTGKSYQEMYDIFNHKSGILGISGVSNDTRDVESASLNGNERATLAIDMFASRIAEYIMMYYGKLGSADLIICSAGVFENSPLFRSKTFELVKEALGIEIDEELNKQAIGKEMIISTKKSRIPVLVLPTDEELMIALDTARLLNI